MSTLDGNDIDLVYLDGARLIDAVLSLVEALLTVIEEAVLVRMQAVACADHVLGAFAWIEGSGGCELHFVVLELM